MERTNAQRAALAGKMLTTYKRWLGEDGPIDAELITDMLADLYHYCGQEGYILATITTDAEEHYLEEVDEETDTTCRECGAALDDAGDGYDGLCPDCADRRERYERTSGR